MKISNKIKENLKTLVLPTDTNYNQLIDILECEYHEAEIMPIDDLSKRMNVLKEIQEINKTVIESDFDIYYLIGNMINNYDYMITNV